MKYLDYTPTSYPYTVEFISEISTKNTAFIESFAPIKDYYVSVESSLYVINFPDNLTIRTKEKNFEGIDVTKQVLPAKITYSVKNILAIKREDYSPPFKNSIPEVLFASSEFNYEGVTAKVDDWESMGKWFNDKLLVGRTELPTSTIERVQNLVKGIDDPIEKAKKVY